MACTTAWMRSTYLGGRVEVRGKAGQENRAVGRKRNGKMDVTAKAVVKRTFQGEESGKEELDLPTAGTQTAKGLVHRYLVYRQQNARRVSPTERKEKKRKRTRGVDAKRKHPKDGWIRPKRRKTCGLTERTGWNTMR